MEGPKVRLCFCQRWWPETGASACLSVRWDKGLRLLAVGPGAVSSGPGPFLALVLVVGCWLWSLRAVFLPSFVSLADPEPPSEALTQRSRCDSPVPASGLCVLASPGLLGYWRRVAGWGPVSVGTGPWTAMPGAGSWLQGRVWVAPQAPAQVWLEALSWSGGLRGCLPPSSCSEGHVPCQGSWLTPPRADRRDTHGCLRVSGVWR